LPRREYTKRKDYNALNVENRHTVTPNGWTHEQDNTKTVRDGRETVQTLVREFGFNDYRSIEGFDFGPARDYWSRTGDYWEIVREAWEHRLSAGATLVLTMEVDGMPLIAGTFEQAANADATSTDEERAAIEALLSEHTRSQGSMTSGLER
jgi:D-alanyl-D-alanine carboxypeptidase